MSEFIEWWFQYTRYTPIFWECPPRRIGAGTIRTVDNVGFVNLDRSEMYLRATTVKDVPKSGRGGASLAGEIPGVWLDVDFRDGESKDFRYPPKQFINDLLDCLPDPSATVETGGGLHLYWKLAEPVDTLDNVGLLECWFNKCNNIWQEHGYLLDNVLNPDRLLRFPGSVNWKQNNFTTTYSINDLEYSVDDLVGDCDIVPPTDVSQDWVDAPTFETAFNETVDMCRVWAEQGFTKTGVRSDPDGTYFLRPGSASSKSLTVWADTGVTSIHSTVVLDKLELGSQHISPFRLCKLLGAVDKVREAAAEDRLRVLESEFSAVVADAEAGVDTSDSRWHTAAQYKILADRFGRVKENKQDLVRPFPNHLLPDLVAAAAEEAALASGASVEMAYTIALGFMSLAVSGEVRVEIYNTPISLFTIVAAAPGSGKSPLLRILGKSLKEHDRKNIAEWRLHEKRYKAELDIVMARLEGPELGGLEQANLEARATELMALVQPPVRLLAKMTPAAMYELLSVRKSVGVLSGEGADWLSSFRDSNSSEVTGDALLEIYDGDSVSKTTKTDGMVNIDCTMSILLATQSANLSKFSNLHQSGLWQRFIYVDLPDKTLPRKGSKDQIVNSENVNMFNTMCMEIFDLATNHFSGKELEVQDDAALVFFEWEYYTKCRGNEQVDNFDERYIDERLYESLSKTHSHALRIAGLQALYRSAETGVLPEITLDDMKAGIGIAEWFYDRRVADSLVEIVDSTDGRLNDLMALLEVKDYITASELIKKSSYFERGSAKEVKKWLSSLIEAGILEHAGQSNRFRKSSKL